MPKQTDVNMRSVVDLALQKLSARGVDAGEISVVQSTGFSVTARSGDVETLEHHLQKSFGVTVFQDLRTGSASSSDFSAASMDAAIEKACTIARFSSPDPHAGLADPNRLAYHYPNCDLFHPWKLSPAEAIALAIDCEKKACAFDPRIVNSEGATIDTMTSEGIYANTLGFLGESRLSEHGVSCSVLAGVKGDMQREDDYTAARNPKDLKSIDAVAKRAAEKALQRLGARRLKTQTCPIIFEAPVAKSLLRSFVQAVSGGNLYRQSSFLLNALGKPVFPAFIDIYQQPHLLSAMGSRPFDSEGVLTENRHYISKGELVSYVLGSYSARKLGLQTTGNAGGVFNLSITSTVSSLQALLKKMDRGLFVTELMGQGVNITTGDYSRGASGFWVENGEIQFPVQEITIAGNLKSLFAGIVAVSSDIDIRSSIRSGSILIDKMTISGD